MSVNREQVRRDVAVGKAIPPSTGRALLAELEQAEWQTQAALRLGNDALAEWRTRAEQAERERAIARREWITVTREGSSLHDENINLSTRLSDAEAQLAAVPALVEALREYAKSLVGLPAPPTEEAAMAWLRLTDALAKWEQAQG